MGQLDGIDFWETFALVIKPTTIRLILSIAVTNGWELRHLDVSNTFLHGILNDKVFMWSWYTVFSSHLACGFID